MKAALIPPTPELKTYGQGNFHLLLSHLLPDVRYATHYARQRAKGSYLVLDNSAHEHGKGDDPEMLLYNALALQCQEIVIPDVLEDADATVESAVTTLETWFEKQGLKNKTALMSTAPAFMYVPQGKNQSEWEMCLRDLVRLHVYSASRYSYRTDFVVGVSKDYEEWEGTLFPLLDHLQEMRSLLRFQVHLLGWGRNLWMIEDYARKYPWVRSTDSAKPFVYALNGIELTGYGEPPEYPKRPKDYFNREMSVKNQRKVARRNCELFKVLAEGTRMNLAL